MVDRSIGDFYANPELLRAQVLFARRVGERVREHPALFAWDLGNEFSNLREPVRPQDAADWSLRLSDTLLEASGGRVTGGMHGEDLERDRNIRPSSIARPWAFPTMHGYSVYSSFARDRLDTNVVPFLCQLQASFSGKAVLFSELGNPQCPPGDHASTASPVWTRPRWRSTGEVRSIGCTHAARWARFGGAGPTTISPWRTLPPFDRAPHELRFGVVRSDGSAKPVAQMLSQFAAEARDVVDPAAGSDRR